MRVNRPCHRSKCRLDWMCGGAYIIHATQAHLCLLLFACMCCTPAVSAAMAASEIKGMLRHCSTCQRKYANARSLLTPLLLARSDRAAVLTETALHSKAAWLTQSRRRPPAVPARRQVDHHGGPAPGPWPVPVRVWPLRPGAPAGPPAAAVCRAARPRSRPACRARPLSHARSVRQARGRACCIGIRCRRPSSARNRKAV